VSTQPNFITPEEYLAIEREAEVRHEYFRGEMFAMAGATEPHVVIADNIGFHFRAHCGSQRCRVYRSDMRLLAQATGLFTYPDVIVVCDESRFLDQKRDTLLNPLGIVEVLSKSTESYDRGKKFESYQTIESLKYYLLVAQDRMRLELYSRTDSGWLLTSADAPDASIEFAGCPLKLSDVYENVDLSAPSA
jgi:Uma2 family endonuclease